MAAKMTKAEMLASMVKETGLNRKQIKSVFEALAGLMKKALGKTGPGVFASPSGIMKIVVVNKPAVPAHKGINPFTKQEQMFAAKPARRVVRIRPLKRLKDLVK